jgi:hypothetical protein
VTAALASEVRTPFVPDVSEPLSTVSEPETFVCSICKSGEMENPTAYTINALGVPVTCQELQDTRQTVSESECERVRSFAAAPCGCIEGAPTTIDTLLLENSEAFSCPICGLGVIGNPNGLVTNDRGATRTCAELDARKASVPSSVCPSLQNSAMEPCECNFDIPAQEEETENLSEEIGTPFSPFTPATEAEVTNPTTAQIKVPELNVTEAVATNPEEVLEIEVLSKCFMCGDGEMTMPEGIVTNHDGRTARCDVLDANPKEITLEACMNIQALTKEPCGCLSRPAPDTSMLNDVIPFECSICGKGVMTNPDGVVTTPQGQAARCNALEANAKTIPEDICPDIQQISKEPCGCTSDETEPAEEVEPWFGDDDSGVCHVCGGAAKKVGNPSSMVTTPIGMFTCYSLVKAGLDGTISMDDCGAVQASAEEECGCYIDTPTPAPSYVFKCPLCEDGMYVTRPEGTIETENNSMTCAQYQEEAARGRIDEDQCSVLQEISGGPCGCQPPPTFPTNAPTVYECEVCGRGREVGLPDAEVMLPNFQKMSCATLQERADTGVIHSSQCARFVPFAQQYCGCKDKPYEPSPEAPPSNHDCGICGPGLKPTNKDGIVKIPNQRDRTCLELMTKAAYGNIDATQCYLLHPYVQEPCGCEDPYALPESPKETPTAGLPGLPAPSNVVHTGDCFDDLGEIQALERGVKDTSVTRMYALCPGTIFDMGVWTEEGEIINGQPFLALRPNVIYRCGHDGHRSNDCILKGGDFGLASYDGVYDGIHETVSGVEIQGLTFQSQNLFSVVLKSAGDITFKGCAFKGNSNNVPVLMQWDGKKDVLSESRRLEESEKSKQVVTFQDCVFRDNFVDDSLSYPGIIENTFDSELIVSNCLFQDNSYGNNNNLASTGYAIRSFGPLTLESTCFIDNVFLHHGPVLVYGEEFSAYDNYVESSQGDLTCELGALFSSKDDMTEATPSCQSSDASVCAFDPGPTASPTVAPVPESEKRPSSSGASLTGRQTSTIGVVIIALCLPFFGL